MPPPSIPIMASKLTQCIASFSRNNQPEIMSAQPCLSERLALLAIKRAKSGLNSNVIQTCPCPMFSLSTSLISRLSLNKRTVNEVASVEVCCVRKFAVGMGELNTIVTTIASHNSVTISVSVATRRSCRRCASTTIFERDVFVLRAISPSHTTGLPICSNDTGGAANATTCTTSFPNIFDGSCITRTTRIRIALHSVPGTNYIAKKSG